MVKNDESLHSLNFADFLNQEVVWDGLGELREQ